MIENMKTAPPAARGPWRLTYDDKHYWFATEAEAKLGLRLHEQASRVLTASDGLGHA